MWYFTVKQSEVTNEQYQHLQKRATLTEVEIFNEPYDNLYLFEVEHYKDFVDLLDVEGIVYEVSSDRPNRSELMAGMQ